jgi:Tfp pilus assembly protein PilZ
MRLLTIVFVSSAELLSHYRDTEDSGALFYRSRTELEKDESVLMEISFPGLPNRALVRGTVATVTPGKGAGIRFTPQDESTRDFLLQVARGEVQITPTINRSFDRFPAELPVDCRVEISSSGTTGERIVSRTVDLGAGGAFIRSLSPPPVGTHVRLAIGPATDQSFATVSLEGHVAWTRNDDQDKGFGVRFHNKSEFDARTLRTLLRKASETGKVGFVN